MAVDHSDVSVVDEHADRGTSQPTAEADVVQPAAVADGNGPQRSILSCRTR